MKKIIIILIALALHGCEECPAMESLRTATISDAAHRFAALSMIESGDNDRAVGRDGEVSRYQISISEWRRVTSAPLSRATNSELSLAVARKIEGARCAGFCRTHGRAPTDFEFYKLWNPHCPDETARRFANLCSRP